MNLKSRSEVLFLVGLFSMWIFISMNFIITLPKINCFTHDFWGHVNYTNLIYQSKKLPHPYQDLQTYQPPLYYLINQIFSPKAQHHVFKVRLASIFYGLIFLFSCHLVLSQWQIPSTIQLLVLFYFMSIPAFVHLFTSYNNDSLAMALAGTITAGSSRFYSQPKILTAILLFLLTALGVYTKYNIILLLITIGMLAWGAFLFRFLTLKKALIIILPLLLGALTILPYLKLHNYESTKKYLPDNADIWPLSPFWNIQKNIGFFRFFFKPPGISNGEWTDPYAFDSDFHYELSPKLFYWTKRTYLSSIISTSLFGEYNYSKKVPSADKWAWIILWIHILILVHISYREKGIQVMSWFLLLTFFTYALYIRFSHFIFNCVNFRFFAWIDIPLCLLVASEINKCYKKKYKKYSLFLLLLSSGSIIHVLFINLLNTNLP